MTQATTALGAKEATPYVDDVIQKFVIAATFWGIVGFLVGDFLAWQMAFPVLNLDVEWLSFGRIRPVHTSAVIFAFGGNVLFATSFYIVQRTSRASLFGGSAFGNFIFWGYQLFIVLAASGYVLGITQGKEYAEPEWYTDLWLTVVWVSYLVAFVGTLYKRKEPHIYVANWFFLAMIITIAMLHLGNNLAVPTAIFGGTWWRSYEIYSGV
jgi:cytochrome c oxidase cbb3-type subunit 1